MAKTHKNRRFLASQKFEKISRKYNYDERSDSLYIHIKEGEEESFEEIAPGINIELDKNNNILGIEVLKASRFGYTLKKSAEIKH